MNRTFFVGQGGGTGRASGGGGGRSARRPGHNTQVRAQVQASKTPSRMTNGTMREHSFLSGPHPGGLDVAIIAPNRGCTLPERGVPRPRGWD